MSEQQKVYIALSGGVDSAICALRLLNDGFQVIGIYMQTWKDPNVISVSEETSTASLMAAKAAESLGIPFVCLDVREHFFRQVVYSFIQDYTAGKTPNPCLFCNPQVKWGILQKYAIDQGADYFATGHYARIQVYLDDRVKLVRGVDKNKDQSYVLSMLSQAQLSRSLLPLGELTKTEVRSLAQAHHLPVAEQQDSQDLCFLDGVDYRDFLRRFAPQTAVPGEIINLNGEVLGEHQGLALYTIGQRKGIRIAASQPYFVVGKDIVNNRLIIGFSHQARKRCLRAVNPNWIAGEPPAVDRQFDVMIRYRAQPIPATLTSITGEEFRLELSLPLSGITPGQVAVLYQGEVCLGGGIIESAW